MKRLKGYLYGKTYIYNIHGIIFTFYEPKDKNKEKVKEKVDEVFDEFKGLLYNETIEEDEAIDPVASYEATGIGFYYIKVLVNDKAWGATTHHRFGYVWKWLSSLSKRLLP